MGELLRHAAEQATGVKPEFERRTGSADGCAELLRAAGFSRVSVSAVPISFEHEPAEARAALQAMLANPMCDGLAATLAADATGQLSERLRAAYEAAVVEAAAAGGGSLRTVGECYLAVGFAY